MEILKKPARILSKADLLWDEKVLSYYNIGQSLHALRSIRAIKIGCYVGEFDDLTPADTVFLQLCRSNCDIFVVVIPTDYSLRLNKKNAVFQTAERAFRLGSLSSVNYIVPFDESSADLAVQSIDPHFIFYGRLKNEQVDIALYRDKLTLIDYPWQEERINGKFFQL